MKKTLFFTTALSALPLLTTMPMVSCGATNQANLSTVDNGATEENNDCCTFVYVGKNVSEDGLPLMCRCMDMSPVSEVNLKVYQRDELANETFVGKNGFTYTLPEHTAKCVVAPVNKNINWGPYVDEMGLNEYGVVMSATLTGATNERAKAAEPFEKSGIAEETIAHTIIPCAKTAREGVQQLVDIISGEQGNAGAEVVFIADQEECWYVELLNGHKAVGVKLPDDKMFVQGNEFALHTLDGYKKNEIIASPGYDTVPYARKSDDGKFDLFRTYARDLTDSDEGRISNDNAHRRTWRGLNLFGEEKYRTEAYNSLTEYNWMFKPVTKPGLGRVVEEGVKIGINDVIGIYRDEFKDILTDEGNPNHGAFVADLPYNLRTIACNSTGQTHFLRVDPNVEQSMAAQAWLSLSPAKYSPFVPLNAAMNSASKEYSFVNTSDDYTDKSAYWAYRTLNTLGNIVEDKTKYPNLDTNLIVKSLNEYQRIWEQEYFQITKYANEIGKSNKRDKFITNYCTSVQEEAVKLVRNLTIDISQYLMNLNPRQAPDKAPAWIPLVDVEEYVKKFGYKYEAIEMGANITKGDKIFTLEMPSGMKNELGKLKQNGTIIAEVEATYRGSAPYIDFMKAIEVFGDSNITPVNMKDYLPNNILVWLLPTIFGSLALIAGGLAFYFCYWKKNHKSKAKSK